MCFDAQKLVGVITLRDIVRAALAEPDIAQVPVNGYMTTQPWVVSPGWSVKDIAAGSRSSPRCPVAFSQATA